MHLADLCISALHLQQQRDPECGKTPLMKRLQLRLLLLREQILALVNLTSDKSQAF